MHVDNPHLPLTCEPVSQLSACPEYLSLTGLRCELDVPTRIVAIDEVLAILPAYVEEELSRPNFTVRRPASFGKQGNVLENVPLLMERASGARSLMHMVNGGQDDEATRILCAVAGRLHTPRTKPAPALVPLLQRFEALWSAAATHRGVFEQSAKTARELLDAPRDVGVLHGDIHHANVLDFGPKGWLAIDPKGLYGERGFDFANIFCNPDSQSALAPGCFARRIEIVRQAGDIDHRRLLQWVLAWTGLSAAWMLEDDIDPTTPLEVAKLATLALGL